VKMLPSLILIAVYLVHIVQGGPKPGILRDFSEHGKLREFSANSVQPQGKIVTNKVFLVCYSNICVKQLLTCCIAGVDVE